MLLDSFSRKARGVHFQGVVQGNGTVGFRAKVPGLSDMHSNRPQSAQDEGTHG
jgi:hypothetical protein